MFIRLDAVLQQTHTSNANTSGKVDTPNVLGRFRPTDDGLDEVEPASFRCENRVRRDCFAINSTAVNVLQQFHASELGFSHRKPLARLCASAVNVAPSMMWRV